CRTRYVLEYFGEDVADDWICGHCDNCQAAPHGNRDEAPSVTATA
ncbi:MAG: RecQ family zinc-binding domain-containing protein, partial [Gemmatimonadaceae bacterium]